LKELRKNLALENVESFRVAKEARHADEHIGVKSIEFFGVATEELRAILKGVLLVQHHSPGNAPLDGCGFVEREIHAAMVAEEEQNLFESVVGLFTASFAFVARLAGFVARRPVAARRQWGLIIFVGRGERPIVFRRGEVCG
jgi:hypothetical protein